MVTCIKFGLNNPALSTLSGSTSVNHLWLYWTRVEVTNTLGHYCY